MKNSQTILVTIAPKSIWMLFVIGIFCFALWKISTIILVILTAVVVAAFVESFSRIFVQRFKLPRIISVILVFLIVLSVFVLLSLLIIPAFSKEMSTLTSMTSSLEKTLNLGDIINTLQSAQDSPTNPFDFIRQIQGSLGQLSTGAVEILQSAFGGIINIILVAVIAFYLAIEEEGVIKFLRAVTPLPYEEYVLSVWRRAEQKIGAWFRGQLLQAIILALLTYAGLWVLSVPYALILSLLAGVLGLIPFGIALAGVMALFVAYTSGGLELMLFTLVWYTALQQFENYVLQPLITNKATGVPSLVVLLSIVIGVSLVGFVGFILSIPLAVVGMELIRDSEQKKKDQMEHVIKM